MTSPGINLGGVSVLPLNIFGIVRDRSARNSIKRLPDQSVVCNSTGVNEDEAKEANCPDCVTASEVQKGPILALARYPYRL